MNLKFLCVSMATCAVLCDYGIASSPEPKIVRNLNSLEESFNQCPQEPSEQKNIYNACDGNYSIDVDRSPNFNYSPGKMQLLLRQQQNNQQQNKKYSESFMDFSNGIEGNKFNTEPSKQSKIPLNSYHNKINSMKDPTLLKIPGLIDVSSFSSNMITISPMTSNNFNTNTNNFTVNNVFVPVTMFSTKDNLFCNNSTLKSSVTSGDNSFTAKKNKNLVTPSKTDVVKTTTAVIQGSSMITSMITNTPVYSPSDSRHTRELTITAKRMGKMRTYKALPSQQSYCWHKKNYSEAELKSREVEAQIAAETSAKKFRINKLKQKCEQNRLNNICDKEVTRIRYLETFKKDEKFYGAEGKLVGTKVVVRLRNINRDKMNRLNEKSKMETNCVTSSEQQTDQRNNIIAENSSEFQLKLEDKDTDKKRAEITNAISCVNIIDFRRCLANKNEEIVSLNERPVELNAINNEVANNTKDEQDSNKLTLFKTDFYGASNYLLHMVPLFNRSRDIVKLDLNSINLESLSAINNRMMMPINLRAEYMLSYRNNLKYWNIHFGKIQYKIDFYNYQKGNNSFIPNCKMLPVAGMQGIFANMQGISDNQILALSSDNREDTSLHKNKQRNNNSIQLLEKDMQVMQMPRKKPENLSLPKGYIPDPEKERIARKAAKLIKNRLVSNCQNTTDLAKAVKVEVKKILSSRCNISKDEHKTNISLLTKINLIKELIRDKKTKKCMQDFIVTKTPKFKMLLKFKMSKAIKKAPNEGHKEGCITKEREKNTNEP